MKIAGQDVPVSHAINWTANALIGAAALMGALAYFGVGITLPFAKADDLAKVTQTIQQVQQQQQQQIQQSQGDRCDTLLLLRDNYMRAQREAQEELDRNPNSLTLQRARDEASTNLTKVNAKLAACP